MHEPRLRFLDEFPYPVAYPYSLIFDVQKPASARRWALCFTEYQLLRLVGLTLVSQYLREPIDASDADAVRSLNTAIAAVRSPFFSDWIALAHALSNQLPRVGVAPFFPKLREALAALKQAEERPVGLRGQTRLAPLEAILALRNATAHGGLPNETEAARHLDAYVPVLHQALTAFDFLADATVFAGAGDDGVTVAAPAGRFLRGVNVPAAAPVELPEPVRACLAESEVVVFTGPDRALPLYPLANSLLSPEPLYLYDGHYAVRIEADQAIERSYVYYLGVEHRVDDSQASSSLKSLLENRRISFFLDRERTAPWTIGDSAADFSRRTLADLTGVKYFPECYLPFPELQQHFRTFLKTPPREKWPRRPGDERYMNGFILVGLAGSGKTAFLASQVADLLHQDAPGREERADRDNPNIVLFIRGNGILLRAEGMSLFRDVAEKLGVAVSEKGFKSFRELFDHLHNQARKDRIEGRRLILVLDALNEAPFAERIIREALELIRTASFYPWCKVVVSTRQEWLSIWSSKLGSQEASPLEELRPLLYVPEAKDSWGEQRPPVVAVEPFSEEQAGRVYERYQTAALSPGGWRRYDIPACRTPWGELPQATRDLLTNPLYLHLFMEAFDGRKAEEVGTTPVLFRLYVHRVLQGRPGLEKAFEPVMAHLLRDRGRPSADLTDDDCNAIRRAWAEGISAEEARLSLSPVEALAHEGFVTKRVREEGGGYRFVFQAVAEYLIYRYLADHRSPRDELGYWARQAQVPRAFAEYVGAFGFLIRDWPPAQRQHLGAFIERAADWFTDTAATFLVEQARTGYVPGVGNPALAAFTTDLIASGQEKCAAALHTAGVQLRDSRFTLAARLFFEAAAVICHKLVEAAPAQTGPVLPLARALTDLGLVLGRLGRCADAEQVLDRAVALHEDLWKQEPTNARLGEGLAQALHSLGLLVRAEGRLAEAEQTYRDSVAVYEKLWSANPSDQGVGAGLAKALTAYGEFLQDRSRSVEAEIVYRRGIGLYDQLDRTGKSSHAVLHGLADALHGLGTLVHVLGRKDEAAKHLGQAVTLLEGLWASSPDNVEVGASLGRALVSLGDLQESQTAGTGRPHYERSAGVYDALGTDRLENLDVKASYAGALCLTGQLELAQQVLTEVLTRVPCHPTANRWQRYLRRAAGNWGGDHRQCEVCSELATLHLSLARQRVCVEELHLCEKHAQEVVEGQVSGRSRRAHRDHPWSPISLTRPGQPLESKDWVEVDVERVIISESYEQQVIQLRELAGERRFVWVVGIYEAVTIDRRLKGIPTHMPQTQDAIVAAIVALGGQVEHCLIHTLTDYTYYCNLRIRDGAKTIDLDMRPSDGVGLALVCGVPIFIIKGLLDQVAERA
jgi:bifunctional DNase/RNase/tetratricopeptide (TPR) repeat protein